jgi:holo-[acyl-carrier protein] synthase
MNIHCGVDMVEIQRIRDSIQRYGDGFIKKIFTGAEIKYCESRENGRYESYAARFAAKEAVSKALGTGFTQGISLKDIETVNSECGKPQVILYNTAKERFQSMGGVSMDVSVSHSRDYAVAFAVFLSKGLDACGK